jgi:hypothetical protein
MKTTHTFRLNKQTNRMLATIVCPIERSVFKTNMIHAQLISDMRPVTK